MKILIISLSLILTSICRAFAQDVEGCKDHPMFNRMPGYTISECSQNFGLAELAMADFNNKSIEGYKTVNTYLFDTEKGKNPYSFFQVVKNYENALSK